MNGESQRCHNHMQGITMDSPIESESDLRQ